MNNVDLKLILTGVTAVVCAISIMETKGQTGIGWFILALIIIW